MKNLILISAVYFFFCASAYAEYYKYTDKEGNVYYTEDYGDVPVDQRRKVKEYTEYKAPEKSKTTKAATQEDEVPNFEYDLKANTDQEAGEALMKIKRELTQEAKDLYNKRVELEKKRKKFKTKKERTEFNSLTKALNKNVKMYEAKQKAFNKEVNEYNKRMRTAMEKDLKKHNEQKDNKSR